MRYRVWHLNGWVLWLTALMGSLSSSEPLVGGLLLWSAILAVPAFALRKIIPDYGIVLLGMIVFCPTFYFATIFWIMLKMALFGETCG